ncbi:MAG: outer membrane beta-barrel family protein [Muribaculaceae bacterium]|nr:outer membrane beta-barrel family protein [Muribaculaceae bacterium]
MKKLFTTFIVLISFLTGAAGYWDNPKIFVEVVDVNTGEFIMGAQAHLLRPDSTLIKTYIADRTDVSFYNRKCNLIVDSIPRTGAILWVTSEGYYPAYVNVPKIGPREDVAWIAPIRLTRIPFAKPKQLDEVTVTASRVKVVVSGDTVTYNADAFSLATGSMLDALIDQLPGAQLKSDGRIFVNGEFVQDLLVNGDHFFRGDPQVALQNLPAYMVKNVKVYHRNEFGGRKPLKELPLVMDVKLKKQFMHGWIANAEAGYGTANRYLGRLFGLLFTPDSRLAIVGNLNNTNDDRKPGQTDNWNPNWQTAGRARTLTGGLDYTWNSRFREWKVQANVMAKQKKSDIETSTVSERYLDGGNLMGSSATASDSRQFRISSDNSVQLMLARLKMWFKPNFLYERTKSNETESSRLNDAQSLLNSLDQTGLVYNKNLKAGAKINGSWQLPMKPEKIDFMAGVDWSKSNRESNTLRELMFPQQPDQSEISAPWEFLPQKELEAEAKASYGMPKVKALQNWIGAYFSAEYSFKHSRVHSTRDYYLRQLDEDMTLPSVVDSRQHAGFVPSNSYDYILNESKHALKLSGVNFFPHLKDRKYQPNINFDAILNYVPGHIDYTWNDMTHSARRNPLYVDPKVGFSIEDVGWIDYRYSTVLPGLKELLDVIDAANPLYVYIGNPDIKSTRVHEVTMKLYDSFTKGPGLEVTYKKYDNMIAQSADYDMTTGVTTYRPVNVAGNWDVTAKLTSPWKWTRLEKWQPEFNVRAMYQNSVDLIGMELSTVRNFNLGGKAKLLYKIMDGMEVTANVNAEWRKVTSPMQGFEPISAVDFDYGIIFRAKKLPWNMSFTTDLMMHSRRGYADSRLNTNDLVWNARLAKSIMQGNLTFAIDGFDILGRLSNVRLTRNSQCRTETRYNTLPRYAMFHVIYRLNIQPKKK